MYLTVRSLNDVEGGNSIVAKDPVFPPVTGESARLRWWLRFVVVPFAVGTLGALGALGIVVGHPFGSNETLIKANPLSDDRSDWGVLFFDDEALNNLATWLKTTTTVSLGISPEEHYARGRAYHQLGDFDHAIAEYVKAESIPQARHMQALSLISLQKPKEACEVLTHLAKEQPDRPDVLYYQGLCLMQQGQYDRAMDWFQRVVGLRPETLGAWYNLGVCHLRRGDYEPALESFDRVCSANPVFARALLNKGFALYHLGRVKEALEAVRRSIEIDSRGISQLDAKEHEGMQHDPIIGTAIRELIGRKYAP